MTFRANALKRRRSAPNRVATACSVMSAGVVEDRAVRIETGVDLAMSCRHFDPDTRRAEYVGEIFRGLCMSEEQDPPTRPTMR